MKLRILLLATVVLLAAGGTLAWWLNRDPSVTVKITQQHIETGEAAAGLLLRQIDIRPDAIHVTFGL